MLGELAVIGMNICRSLDRRAAAEAALVELSVGKAQVDAAEPEGAAPAVNRSASAKTDIELSFSRASKSVRQCLALQAKLERDAEADAARFGFQRASAAHDLSTEQFYARQRAGRHRNVVRRAVERAIDEQTPEDASTPEAESDYEQLIEGLDAQMTLFHDDPNFLGLPVSDCVTLICQGLGLKADPRYWEALELRPDEDEDEDDDDAPTEAETLAGPDAEDEDEDDDPGGSRASGFGSPHLRRTTSVHRGLRPLSETRGRAPPPSG